jgi:hypothetical protein
MGDFDSQTTLAVLAKLGRSSLLSVTDASDPEGDDDVVLVRIGEGPVSVTLQGRIDDVANLAGELGTRLLRIRRARGLRAVASAFADTADVVDPRPPDSRAGALLPAAADLEIHDD